MKRICQKCKTEKDTEKGDFYLSGSKLIHYLCKPCFRENLNLKRKSLKEIVLHQYGSVCVCCGEKTKELLTVYPKENESVKFLDIDSFLIKNNFPENFETLCFSCQTGRRLYKICPHRWVRLDDNTIEGFTDNLIKR